MTAKKKFKKVVTWDTENDGFVFGLMVVSILLTISGGVISWFAFVSNETLWLPGFVFGLIVPSVLAFVILLCRKVHWEEA